MPMGGLKGPTKKVGGMAGKNRSVNGVKNVQSSRRPAGSNAGAGTAPIKGPDKGRG